MKKINFINLENRCSNKSQDLEYNIDLALYQLCIIERKLGKLIGYEKSQEFENFNITKIKNQWIVKKKAIYLVVNTILKTINNNLWYLDSGCSKYMLGDKGQFKTFEFLSGGLVTFKDGSTTTTKGK